MCTLGSSWQHYHDAGERALLDGNAHEAEGHLLLALKAAQDFIPHDRRRIKSLESLAHLYRLQGKRDLAGVLYRGAVGAMEKGLGPQHSQLAIYLEHLALFFTEDFQAAEALIRRAQAIREKAWGLLSPDLALSDLSLAILHVNHGQPELAERHYRRALARVERARGPHHPDVVFYLQELAWFYRCQERYTEAQALYERVLAIVERYQGWDDAVLCAALEDLARLYGVQGKRAEAEALFRRVQRMRGRSRRDNLTA